MNCGNLCDEEYTNSEAWLAEQIFSQLKDFNTEPPKDEEISKLSTDTEPDSHEVDGTISSDVLDLGAIQVSEQVDKEPQQEKENLCPNLEEQLNVPEKHDTEVAQQIHQDQQLFQYFGEISKVLTNAQQFHTFSSSDPSLFFPQNNLQVIVECANCNCIFDADSFRQHVCDYGEDNNLIIPEPMEQSLTSCHAGPVEPACMRLLRENQIRIRRFLKDELKYDLNSGNSNTKKQDGPHECTLCERKFVHASGLSRHMEKHALDLIPTTTSANTSNGCPSITSLKVVIKCTICGRIFFETKTAFEHFGEHFPGKPEDEQEFGETGEFPYENYLDDALNFLKSESKKPDNEPTSYFKMVILSCVLQCEFCDLLFSEVPYLLAHSACHQPQRPFECRACEIRVFTSKEIFMHWQAECVFARENMKRGCSLQRFYVCNVCENKHGSLEQLHEHRYSSNHFFPRLDKKGVLLLPCEYCDRVFETAKDIAYHYGERHYKKTKRDPTAKYRQYLCDICGKTYTQSSHLWQHLRFHKGVKPFACKEPGCSRRFTIRPDLNDHIRKCHTGERPYHCLICGRRFLTGSVFYQHRLIHRGERRYGCDECGKRFYRADALKNHLRIHTGEKPYGCLFCTKSFRQRGDRDKHIRARHSSLDANARLMMQMRKLQLEAAARATASSTPAEDVVMVGNIPFPKSMFQPMLPDIDAGQDCSAIN